MPQELVIQTPENAEIRVPLAGMFSRAAAFVHDVAIQFVSLFVVHVIFLVVNQEFLRTGGWFYELRLVQGMYFIAMFVVVFGYYSFFELYRNGQTPGKKAHGLRVVSLSGQRVGLFSSLLRNFLRIADFMPFMFLAGVFTTLITDRHQRIGDLFAGTVVIRTDRG